MIHNTRPSQTALAVTLIRAASYQEAIPSFHSEDLYAHYFIPPLARFLIHFPAVRSYIRTHLPDQTYQYVVDRTRFIDNIVIDCLARQFRQIVILGAGYDSRSLRLVNHENVTVYECDKSATQQQKNAIINRHHFTVSRTRYCEIDLGKKTLSSSNLPGFNPSHKTLFLLEGLLMYLSRDEINRLFTQIGCLAAPDSELVFDLMHELPSSKSADIVTKQGEPYRGCISKDQLPDFLMSHQMSLLTIQPTIQLTSSFIHLKVLG